MENPYVSLIQNGKVHTSIGITKRYSSEQELLHVVSQLIDEGYAFVDEPAGWPPAAILQEMQSKGLLKKAFQAITWLSQDKYKKYTIFP